MPVTSETLCECGHAVAEHGGGTGNGRCYHDRSSEVRPSCTCKAFLTARICVGCGGDGIDYAVSARRRQIAARELVMEKMTVYKGAESVCSMRVPGVECVANPLMSAILRLESRAHSGFRVRDEDLLAPWPEGGYYVVSLPDLSLAAFGIGPDEMCHRCYGYGGRAGNGANLRRVPVASC